MFTFKVKNRPQCCNKQGSTFIIKEVALVTVSPQLDLLPSGKSVSSMQSTGDHGSLLKTK